jgi:hypothetical protein
MSHLGLVFFSIEILFELSIHQNAFHSEPGLNGYKNSRLSPFPLFIHRTAPHHRTNEPYRNDRHPCRLDRRRGDQSSTKI